jgi:hypothetical protein
MCRRRCGRQTAAGGKQGAVPVAGVSTHAGLFLDRGRGSFGEVALPVLVIEVAVVCGEGLIGIGSTEERDSAPEALSVHVGDGNPQGGPLPTRGSVEPAPEAGAGWAIQIDEEDSLDLLAGLGKPCAGQPVDGLPHGTVALAVHLGAAAFEDFGAPGCLKKTRQVWRR